MKDTNIEWTDATWNCLRGCSRVSPGCENCYAERMAARFSGKGQPYEGLAKIITKTRVLRREFFDGHIELKKAEESFPRWTGQVRLIESKLEDPLRWRKPRMIFVNSMSDMFHEKLDLDTIARIWAVMTPGPLAHLPDPHQACRRDAANAHAPGLLRSGAAPRQRVQVEAREQAAGLGQYGHQ
jgi:protein gp37